MRLTLVITAALSANVVDSIKPTGTIVIDGPAVVASKDVTLTLTCDDGTGSGCAMMMFKNDCSSTWSTPEAVAASEGWTICAADGMRTVSVMFQDAVGNDK